LKTIEWQNDKILILDQTRLPGQVEYVTLSSVDEVAHAIKSLQVRGAPLIGVVAAWGLVLAVMSYSGPSAELAEIMNAARQQLTATRPTAVNLQWAVSRMMEAYDQVQDLDLSSIRHRLTEEARAMQEEDLSTNRLIGEWGARLLHPDTKVLTICNAGALATCGHGTALGIVRSAFAQGKIQKVWVSETRPVLQGARLTAWELSRDEIPATLITDNMAGFLMQRGEVDAVITGADRIAANGDTANKIGTYSLAVLARYHDIPFYVAAPVSSIDISMEEGSLIPIEERDPDEVRIIGECCITSVDIPVVNPAFDVTPSHLITAIVTEKGIVRGPYLETLAEINNVKR